MQGVTESMIQIQQLKLRPDHTEAQLREKIAKKLKIKDRKLIESLRWEILRRSVDARKKPDIFYVYTIRLSVKGEDKLMKRLAGDKDISPADPVRYHFPGPSRDVSAKRLQYPPVIVGAGPAGYFCALMLARAGYAPILIERGDPVEKRDRCVNDFWNGGRLDPDSNVQFGEGGAGTFSDGKLTTMIHDGTGRIPFVLDTFVSCGADESIRYEAKPHIGTDILKKVLVSLRSEIMQAGGRICFRHALADIRPFDDGGKNTGTVYELTVFRTDGTDTPAMKLKTQALVLAPGHSARDTFRMLQEKGLHMSAKAFAVGVRIEHPQKWINDAMYSETCPYEMEPASYKLTCSVTDDDNVKRGVYSFCMCPGGYVVNASSEEGHLAVNGMSDHARDTQNANSAIVVSISPEDYQARDPLDGIRFQRELERKAYQAGGGAIPMQRLADFRDNITTDTPGKIFPVVKGKAVCANLRRIFPEALCNCLIEGIDSFGDRIAGFNDDDVLLLAPESRTSSPVRVTRDPSTLESVTHPGIYPCGEGAGYAGGIMSAAVDGIRVAEAVAGHFTVDFPID